MNIEKIAFNMVASFAEKEVERLLKYLLPKTRFKGHAFAVGGYPRDQLMGLEAKDLDIVVDLKNGAKDLTQFIYSQFPNEVTHPMNMGNYPIWQITFKDNISFNGETYKTAGAVIEFAESMRESFSDPNSRQRQVEFATLKEDVLRRDISANSLLKDLTSGELLDLTGQSINDIQKGIVRGNPGVDFNKILSEDPLRLLRIIRFAVKYGWTVPLSVLKAVKNNASRIQIVSEERVRDELIKIMKLGKLAQAVKFFESTGLLKYIFPEIQALKGVKQNEKFHSEGDALRHTLMVLKNAPSGIESQLSALLHDAGKASTTELIDGTVHSYGHEKVSGEIAEAVMRRLKFDLPTIRKVRTIVENHMRPHALSDAGTSGIRKFIREVGDELVDAVLDLARADELGKIPQGSNIPGLKEKVDEARKFKPQTKNKAILDGTEIMQTLNIKPSAKVKEVTNFLFELEDSYIEKGKIFNKDIAKQAIIDKFGV